MESRNDFELYFKLLNLEDYDILSKENIKTKYYHYTTLKSLISILESQDIWLSNTKFLNDSAEIENCREILSEVLHTSIDDINTPNVDYYTFSFCKRHDILSQWCKYSQNGTGICIEFDFSKQNYFQLLSLKKNFVMGKVLYDKEEKKILLKKIIQRAETFLKILNKTDDINYSDIAALGLNAAGVVASFTIPLMGLGLIGIAKIISSIAENNNKEEEKIKELFQILKEQKKDLPSDRNLLIYQLVQPIFPYFKNQAFAEEDEVRFIYSSITQTEKIPINYRISDSNVVNPYIKFSDLLVESKEDKNICIEENSNKIIKEFTLPISRLYLGPCENRDWVKKSLEFFIEQRKLKIKVEKSDIPYRG